ncbi:MAG: PTS sugar transporter subunit IIB [Clostridiales bacterium]|nr:PTS sugar transporter subunit IIB [Clostridiales bacterium]
MKNIVLCRIDDRLIHGQVVTSWVKQTGGNKIIVVDDALTKDLFMQKILKAAAPPDVKVEVLNTLDATDVLKEEAVNGEKIIILVKIPQILEKLIEGGVTIPKIILGGMGAKDGRKKFNRNVSASEEEVESMKKILGLGTEIYYQLVPTEAPTDVRKLLSE